MDCMHDDDDVDEEESMHMVMRSCSFMDMIPPMTLTSLGPDESLLFGDKVELLLFMLLNLGHNQMLRWQGIVGGGIRGIYREGEGRKL